MSKSAHRARSARLKVAVAVTVLGTAAACLTGCSSSGGGSSTAATTLTIAAASAPISFDPTKNSNGGTQTFYQELTYEPLIEKSSSGAYAPGLATKWGYVPGHEGTEFEVTLRSGAKFSDGSAVTAAAVANSINYFSKNATGPSSGSFQGITATGESSDKVLLTSATPNPTIAELLTAYNYAGDIINPTGLAAPSKLANATFGAGPYVYQPSQSVTNSQYVFTPNKYYYDQSRIHFKKVVVKVISDNTSALSALRSGQVQIFQGDNTQSSAAKSAGQVVTAATSDFTGVFLMDWEGKVVPALGNLQVRQALNDAVDRPAIAKAVFGTYGKATEQPNTPGWDAYDPSLNNTYPYSPTKAKQLLSQAGDSAFSFNLLYAAFEPTTTKVVQAFAQQLSQVGVTVNLTGASNFSELVSDLGKGTYSGLSLQWGGQTQYSNTNELFTTSASVNPYKNTVQGLDKAFQEYNTSADAGRTAAAHAVEKILVQQAVSVPIVQQQNLWISSPKLKGFKLDPTGVSNSPADWTLTK